MRAERTDFRPERADFRSERADFRPERVDFRPERADFKLERAWGKQMNELTNESLLGSTGLRPLWGHCPKGRERRGKRSGENIKE